MRSRGTQGSAAGVQGGPLAESSETSQRQEVPAALVGPEASGRPAGRWGLRSQSNEGPEARGGCELTR